MALNLKLSNKSVNGQANTFRGYFASGKLRIYNASQPANADAVVTTQTLLAELAFADTAFPASSSGIITANAITADSSANASGVAAWFRCVSTSSAPLMDGTVGSTTGGTTAFDIVLNSVAIVAGAQVSISAFEHTVSKSA